MIRRQRDDLTDRQTLFERFQQQSRGRMLEACSCLQRSTAGSSLGHRANQVRDRFGRDVQLVPIQREPFPQ